MLLTALETLRIIGKQVRFAPGRGAVQHLCPDSNYPCFFSEGVWRGRKKADARAGRGTGPNIRLVCFVADRQLMRFFSPFTYGTFCRYPSSRLYAPLSSIQPP